MRPHGSHLSNSTHRHSPLAFAVALALGLVCAAPEPVLAADSGQNARNEEDLQNVIVTARRREERSQDVPLAIAVLDAQAIDSRGTFNVGRLQQLQPSIQFYSSNQRNSAVNIR